MRCRCLVMLPALTGALVALVAATTAHAGTYTVRACDAGFAGGANNAFAAIADNGMTAYTACPAGQGIVARNVYDNGQSGWLQGAYMIFDAPPGTFVEAVSFEAGWRRHSCSWGLALVASNYDLGGNVVWGYGANQLCDFGQIPSDTDFYPYRFTVGVGAPRLRVETRCGAPTCPRNGVAAMRVKNVAVTVRDETLPVLADGRGTLWRRDGWLAGEQSVGFSASDASGISASSVKVDGQPAAGRGVVCDVTQRVPCPQGGLDANLKTVAWSDGTHTLTLDAVDAAGNRTTTSRTIRIDNTPPGPPSDVRVAGPDTWRSVNDFDLTWSTPPAGSGAPVAAAEWEMCPVDGGPCARGGATGDGISRVPHLRLPAPGAYAVKVWLRDAAGNADPRLASPPVTLRYDDSSPELAFEPLSPEDPTRLVVSTADRGSGVTGGQVSIRRQGTEAWTALPTTLEGTKLTARLDDERLADGVYDLSAVAVDAAGNQRSTRTRTDGLTAEVTLPLRLKTHLRAGVVRRRGGRARLVRSAYVRYGQVVRVRGRLTTPEGNPLQDVEVQAITQVRGGGAPPRLIATVRTTRTGRFTFLVRRGPSRTITLRYPGAGQIRSATRVVQLNVRSRTTMRADRRRVANGESVWFTGRVLTGRIPDRGKLVELQVWVRGKWRTFATARAVRRGRWRYSYRFDGTHRTQRYRFRAKVPPEAGYPFATGRSRVVRVRVRGG